MKSQQQSISIFIFFLILHEFHHVSAQLPPSDADPASATAGEIPQSQYKPGEFMTEFKPSLAVITGVLSIMFTLTFFLFIYAKCFHNDLQLDRDGDSDVGRHDRLWQGIFNISSRFSGLDKSSIESLPFFKFSALKGSKQGLECCVCLSKFEEIEILRLLPKCRHAFHIGCIDQWLEQHATCPLCRNRVSIEDILSDLSNNNSFRNFNQSESTTREDELSLELYIEREEEGNCNESSSRFSIGGSFRKILKMAKREKIEEIEIENRDETTENKMHKFNHKIVISDSVLKNRWSNLTSSDLTVLTSEMLNSMSSDRFSSIDRIRRDDLQNKKKELLCSSSSSSRSKSEITAIPRISVLNASKGNVESGSTAAIASTSGEVTEERRRELWLPIARKTAEWFVNREKSDQLTTNTSRQNLNV